MWISLFNCVVLTVIITGSQACDDLNAKCLIWKQYCNQPSFKHYMKFNCKKTCDLCPKCEDVSNTCDAADCKDPMRMPQMAIDCQKTCGYCVGPTTPPLRPPTPTWKVIPAGKCGVPKVLSARVINGENARKGAWPWQILMKFMGEPKCGGAIISPFWVVTAAHCVQREKALINEFKIVVGDHDFNVDEGTETEIDVSKIISHEEYHSPSQYNNDIALIKLSRPVPFDDYVGTVCLPESYQDLPVGTDCFITGWGKTSTLPWSEMHHKLQQAKLPIVENQKCHLLNENTTSIPVTSNMLCAGYGQDNPTSGCHGDSGGPLVCKTGQNGNWELHGAVSWGSSDCDTNEAYTVFARVANFRDWIDKTVAEN